MIYVNLGLLFALFGSIPFALKRKEYFSFTENYHKYFLSISFVSLFLVGTTLAYFFPPKINIFSHDMWLFILLSLFIGFCFFFFNLYMSYEYISSSEESFFQGLKNIFLKSPLFLFICVYFTFFTLTTSPIFYHEEYSNLLNVEETKTFKEENLFLDQKELRTVDKELSKRAASEIIGRELGMGSRYTINETNAQKVNNELRWIGSFDHKNIFKWLNEQTTPGYISVSLKNYKDAKMEIDNKNINYGTYGFYFSSYLPRHIYQNGYNDKIFGEHKLEIDDNGKPFWITSIITPKIGMGGKIVNEILITNAESGEIKEYKINEIPKWADRVYPEKVAEELIEYWGKYQNGWWNGFVVGNNVITPTKESSLVMTKEGKTAWYTGIQSKGKEQQGTMGFMLFDTKTGTSTFYRREGITETVAKKQIEGRVQEAKYTATTPIPYNINGISTYVSILKDDNGNPQGFGMVSYNDRQKVATGANLEITLRRYLSAISSNNNSGIDVERELTKIKGKLVRSVIQNSDNRTLLHFMLNGSEYDDKFYTVSADGNKEALHSKDNDLVEIVVTNTTNDNITVMKFDNLNIEN